MNLKYLEEELVFNHLEDDLYKALGVDDMVPLVTQGVNSLVTRIVEGGEQEDRISFELNFGTFLKLFCSSATNVKEAIALLVESAAVWSEMKNMTTIKYIAHNIIQGNLKVVEAVEADYLDLDIRQEKLYKMFKVSEKDYKELLKRILDCKSVAVNTYIEESKNEDEEARPGGNSYLLEWWIAQANDLKQLYLVCAMFSICSSISNGEGSLEILTIE